MRRNEAIIKDVEEWQNSDYTHELTCGNDSDHGILLPKEVDGEVILVCPDCDYVQDYIPIIVIGFSDRRDQIEMAVKKYLKLE